jgi:hypothetical protein
MSLTQTAENSAEIGILFVGGTLLPDGTSGDTVTINVCYDLTCNRHFRGSPFTVPVTTPRKPASSAVCLRSLSRRARRSHDVLKAEFSKSLNRSMTSSHPAHALYAFDIATGERQVLLDWPATAVAVSPDGLRAAVGHNHRITVVDLRHWASLPHLLR